MALGRLARGGCPFELAFVSAERPIGTSFPNARPRRITSLGAEVPAACWRLPQSASILRHCRPFEAAGVSTDGQTGGMNAQLDVPPWPF